MTPLLCIDTKTRTFRRYIQVVITPSLKFPRATGEWTINKPQFAGLEHTLEDVRKNGESRAVR